MPASPPAPPWYKSPWPWFLMSIPALAVVGGIVMLYLAITSNDGLVSDDYYKEGQAINEQLDRDRGAARLGLHAQVLLADNGKDLRVVLDRPTSAALRLKVVHPTRAGLDQTVALKRETERLYTATLAVPLTQPRWRVELADAAGTWRLTGVWQLDLLAPLELKPAVR
ncbi:FixH family protein [Chitiniphilus purpureus]|uniref:FixH family protein n=1 Tax=Chitiniphilus purpureus TaxID=2981137 RepID=A0ABY6DI24_9NEIS|nr:FixH family protein [Chitiniphilus sp. CD1]UXY13977.1 FixH family protein [Chitiniphilus sp. CD1]